MTIRAADGRLPPTTHTATDSGLQLHLLLRQQPADSTYPPYPPTTAGARLTAVAWTSSSMGMNFAEMYNYSQGGLMVGKRMQIVSNPDPNLHGFNPPPETSNLDTTFTYDNEGTTWAAGYPNWPQSFSYTTDTLGRPSGITASPLNSGDSTRVVVKGRDLRGGRGAPASADLPGSELALLEHHVPEAELDYNTLFQATHETGTSEGGRERFDHGAGLAVQLHGGQNNGRITSARTRSPASRLATPTTR